MREPTTRLRIDLAYDGEPFAGFAAQPDQHTVQGVLEDALSRVLTRGEVAVSTVVAGRTDRGVHAEAQTVHADVPADAGWLADLPKLTRILDRMVGPAITVHRIRRVPASFDARFSATLRRYRYRLCDARAMPPLWRHDTWHIGRHDTEPVDVDAMDAAGQSLVGEHDFASFCRRREIRLSDGRRVEGTTMRTVTRLAVRRSRPAGLVLVRIDGTAFCHQMVRSITGTLVEVGRGRRPVDWVGEVLDARDRSVAGPVAPPQGLSLVGVRY
ncbi:tRNA pseudouridine(38-40) synthase TruA [Euzebya sp.]|uniref:tRNA pseudouridine(38-40) synthase TruA n=1 Tax=Euzebya sp. TaxID=1971409 RepID=UPI0035195EA6